MSYTGSTSRETRGTLVSDLIQAFVESTARADICLSHQLHLKRLEGSTSGSLSYTVTVRPIRVESTLRRCMIDDVEIKVQVEGKGESPVSQYGRKAMDLAMRRLSWEVDEILSEMVLTVHNLHAKTTQYAETRLIYTIRQKSRSDDQDKDRLDRLQPIFSFFASATTSASWGRTQVPILESLSYPEDSLIFTFSAVPRQTIEPRCEVSKAISDLDAFQLEWL